MSHYSRPQQNTYIHKKYFKMHIKPKIYHSLDKASYNGSSLQYLYCA